MIKKYNLTIDKESSGLRVDLAIIKSLNNEITRSTLKNNMSLFRVNDKNEKLSYKCKINDRISFELNINSFENIIPEQIPLEIVYEDENYIVINKASGMVVHPAKGNYQGTLVNALLGMNKSLYESDDRSRLGIVHRLDKETSGLIIIAKNKDSFEYLSGLFRKRNIIKKYHAVTYDYFPNSNYIIENNIGRHPKNRKKMAVLSSGGKNSITIIEKVIHYKDYSYLDILLKTGRTHQIRVHLSNLGYPIVGDLIYSRRNNILKNIPLCLVSYQLSFFDRFTSKNLEFKIDDPPHIKKLCGNLANN
jgi:23S rRNA pseudouridine1911/1915/1917 synthase